MFNTPALILCIFVAIPNAWGRLEILPKVQPGVFRGVDDSGGDFFEVHLRVDGKGVLKICSFYYPEKYHDRYEFAWTSFGSNVKFHHLKRTSSWDDEIVSVEADWRDAGLKILIKGADWKWRAFLVNVDRWNRAVSEISKRRYGQDLRAHKP